MPRWAAFATEVLVRFDVADFVGGIWHALWDWWECCASRSTVHVAIVMREGRYCAILASLRVRELKWRVLRIASLLLPEVTNGKSGRSTHRRLRIPTRSLTLFQLHQMTPISTLHHLSLAPHA